MQEVYQESEVSEIASKIMLSLVPEPSKATVVGLVGDLGAGKTTLVKELAKILGIKETVVSPTFVVAKFYQAHKVGFENLVHIDAYRIENDSELDPLGWDEILEKPKTLVVIEWPEIIKQRLPKDTQMFTISHHGEIRHIKKNEN